MRVAVRLLRWEGNGGAEGIRTPDPKTASLVLSQLSYSPTRGVTVQGHRDACQGEEVLPQREVGGGEGSRTPTPLRATDFESVAAAGLRHAPDQQYRGPTLKE